MVISGEATMQGLRATKKGLLLEEMAGSRVETSKKENKPRPPCSRKSGSVKTLIRACQKDTETRLRELPWTKSR